jgi:hypothetical protein
MPRHLPFLILSSSKASLHSGWLNPRKMRVGLLCLGCALMIPMESFSTTVCSNSDGSALRRVDGF